MKRHRFDPTYKELKLGEFVITTDMLQRFDPTYKELKRANAVLPVAGPAGFDPTYKELKLAYMVFLGFLVQGVLILPIRN